MKAAIITVAGISSRFNSGVPTPQKELKAIYTEKDAEDTLLYHLLVKCAFADVIVVVGGYKYEDLERYCAALAPALRDRLALVRNDHYEDLASGYSLYLGLREAFGRGADEILFVEGDLDVDDASFRRVVDAENSVLTYTYEPIYANKAVVLYRDAEGRYKYAFNSSHGLLKIEDAFSCVLNSGQVWKFTRADLLRQANDRFYAETRDGTNLRIIQNYLEAGAEAELVPLVRWTNCNTKEDFRRIMTYWEAEE